MIRKTKYWKHLILVFFATSVLNASAQSIDPDDSFTIELGLPNAFVNKLYKTIMQGLVCVAPSYQYTLKNGLSFGTGLHYTYYNVNQFRVPTKIYGGIHTAAAFVKIGHEKFWTERIGTDIGLRVGYLQSITRTDALEAQGIRFRRSEALFWEPTVAFVITGDVNSSYRLSFGYPIYGWGFKPWTIGVTSSMGYDTAEYAKACSSLTVSFGYTFYFNGKKSQAGGFDE